jgi:hypothetical protein
MSGKELNSLLMDNPMRKQCDSSTRDLGTSQTMNFPGFLPKERDRKMVTNAFWWIKHKKRLNYYTEKKKASSSKEINSTFWMAMSRRQNHPPIWNNWGQNGKEIQIGKEI